MLALAAAAIALVLPRLAERAHIALPPGLRPGDARGAPTSVPSLSASPASVAPAPLADIGPPEPRIGKLAPEIRVPDLAGGTLELAQLRGKVVLLNFWASWCKPCEAEMADLQALHTELAPRGFTVIGLNEGEEPGRAAEFLRAKAITFPNGVDSDMAVTRRYQIFGLPNSFVIDGNGVVADHVVGPLTLEQMRARVIKALDGRPVERPRFTSLHAAMAAENDAPAAEAHGQPVTVGEVNRRVDLENALALLRGGLPPDPATDQGRAHLQAQQRAMAERLIDERIIGVRARAVGLSVPDEEVASDVRRIAGEANLDVPGLRRELAALGSDLALLEQERRAARLIGAFTLEYILTGRTPERTQDVDAWMAGARAAAQARILHHPASAP